MKNALMILALMITLTGLFANTCKASDSDMQVVAQLLLESPEKLNEWTECLVEDADSNCINEVFGDIHN